MINLLPPKEKKALLEERTKKHVIVLSVLVFAFLFSLGLILASFKFYSESRVNFQKIILEQKRQFFELSKEQQLEKEIEGLNEILFQLNIFYQEKFYLTESLETLSKTFPQGLYLTNLSFQKETLQFFLAGFAPTRETLSLFKNNLEKEKAFRDVYFPTSNWLEPKDVEFSVSFKLNKRQ